MSRPASARKARMSSKPTSARPGRPQRAARGEAPGQQPEQRLHRERLAGARLADDAENLPGAAEKLTLRDDLDVRGSRVLGRSGLLTRAERLGVHRSLQPALVDEPT